MIALLPDFLARGFRFASLPWIGPTLETSLPRFFSEGFGFNFYFGQILLNWSFAHRLPFLETVPDPVNGPPGFVFVEEKPGGFRSSFFIGTRF